MKICKRLFSFMLVIVLLVSSMTMNSSAASKVTTVEAIPQKTNNALIYFKNNVGAIKKSGRIPGLMQTVTRTTDGKKVTTCSGMVPQGFTFAGDYILISAYCKCGKKHCSVIYVIAKSDRKYKTTLILDTTCHVGGIARAGSYIWVCDSDTKSLRAYKYSSIAEAVNKSYKTISTQSKQSVAVTPSYLCAAKGYLYVGKHYEDKTTAKIYYYKVNGKTITKKGYFTISGVSKIQGIAINGEYMVITSSLGRTNKSNAYVYRDSSKFLTNKKTYRTPIRALKLPNMVEGCYISSSYTYFVFESGAKEYRSSPGTMPLDRYLAVKNSTIGINI